MAESEVGRLRAAQVIAVMRLDTAQVVMSDGARSLVEWVSAIRPSGIDGSLDDVSGIIVGACLAGGR